MLLRAWNPSSLVYHELDYNDFRFDPSMFDAFDQPPPVHILYPRPTPPGFHNYKSGVGHLLLSNAIIVLVVVTTLRKKFVKFYTKIKLKL